MPVCNCISVPLQHFKVIGWKRQEGFLFFSPLFFSSLWHYICDPQKYSYVNIPFIILLTVCPLGAVDSSIYSTIHIHLFITHSAEISCPVCCHVAAAKADTGPLWPNCALLLIHVQYIALMDLSYSSSVANVTLQLGVLFCLFCFFVFTPEAASHLNRHLM